MNVQEAIKVHYNGVEISLEQVMNAVEKQMPKKVVQPFGTGEGCYCPSCQNGIDKDYCGYCGQSLDWN